MELNSLSMVGLSWPGNTCKCSVLSIFMTGLVNFNEYGIILRYSVSLEFKLIDGTIWTSFAMMISQC